MKKMNMFLFMMATALLLFGLTGCSSSGYYTGSTSYYRGNSWDYDRYYRSRVNYNYNRTTVRRTNVNRSTGTVRRSGAARGRRR